MKKKLKKYQIAGKNKRPVKPFVQSDTYATSALEDSQMSDSPFDDIESANPDYEQPNDYANPVGDFFNTFNPLAQVATGVANTITDYKNRRQEQKRLIDSLRGQPMTNYNEDGLNQAPIYFKKGGWIQGAVNEDHKGYCTPMTKATCTPRRKALARTFKKHHGFHQLGGETTIPIEAEGGEVYMTPNSRLKKIPDSAPAHEQGGVVVNDADRVLEDTSTYRKDPDSKALRLSPDKAELLTGVRPKGDVSHSEALEQADKHYTKYRFKVQKAIEKNLKSLESDKLKKYPSNSLQLNMTNLSTVPTSGDIFDQLFEHQELMKAMSGIDQVVAKCGGKYSKMMKAQFGAAGSLIRIRDLMAQKQQQAESQTQGGHSWRPVRNEKFDPKDWYYDPQTGKWLVNATVYGNRKGAPTVTSPTVNPSRTANSVSGSTSSPVVGPRNFEQANSTAAAVAADSGTQPNKFNFINNKSGSEFNEPLNWFDVAGPIGNYLSATDRIPTTFNPTQFNEVRLKRQNPNAALQAGTADYNAALKTINNTGAMRSGASNLFATKYNIDNQILGQSENANASIANQETMYNAQVRDRQGISDQQSRGTFQDQFLGSIEAQRQQLSTSADEIYNRLALNKKLNREGSLLMKLFPAYDQYGERNDYRYQFRAPIGFPNEAQTKQKKS